MTLRRLYPEPGGDVDAFELYGDTPATFTRIGMVASADGSATDEDGWTGGLGGDADLAVFRTLRALADGIMMGAGTLRGGPVGPHRMPQELAERRRLGGRTQPAAIVVVSASLDLDWSMPVFAGARTPTLVVTCSAADDRGVPPDRRGQLVVAGDRAVDLAAAIEVLRERHGIAHLLCEGGPRLAAALISGGLADELCLSVAPTLLGAAHHTPLLADLPHRVAVTIGSIALGDGVLFLRYRLG